MPIRVSDEVFDECVNRALDSIPDELVALIDNCVVLVVDAPPPGEDVFGFYDGIPGPQGDEATHAVLERYIPLRRLGKPEDLQGALVYLVCNEASFTDAEIFMVDGAIAVHA